MKICCLSGRCDCSKVTRVPNSRPLLRSAHSAFKANVTDTPAQSTAEESPLPHLSQPRVGIIITTYNRADYLRGAVESVLAQTYTNWKLIICDDASRDETEAVCDELCKRDPRIEVLRHPRNVGMVENARSGFEAVDGEFFARLDDDNCWLPTFLEKSVAALDACPQAAFAFSDEWFMHEDGKLDRQITEQWSRHYGRDDLRPGLQEDSASVMVQQSTSINVSLFRRAAVCAVGGFSSGLTAGLDYDLFLKLAQQGYRCTYLAERLGEYRLHDAQSTLTRVHHVNKAQDIVAMLEACKFTGRAERLRRRSLTTSYMSLGRTLLLNGRVSEARAAIHEASCLAPLHPRPHVVRIMLNLPTPVRQRLVARRY